MLILHDLGKYVMYDLLFGGGIFYNLLNKMITAPCFLLLMIICLVIFFLKLSFIQNNYTRNTVNGSGFRL